MILIIEIKEKYLMKPDNNHNKLRQIESLIILNMLQQPSCFININDKSKKNSTCVKQKNKVKTEFMLAMKETTIDDVTEHTKNNGEINTTTTNDISKIPEKINTNHFENLISTLPIIIAEKNIDIPIESTFKLKNAALDIKNIKNDICLTKSKLLPMLEKKDISSSLKGKLFLEGFIRKKLDFSIVKGVNDNMINLDTECVIIYIPFKCATLVNYKIPPVLSKEKMLDYMPIYISSECSNINNDYNECLGEKNTQCNEYTSCGITPINCEIEQAKIYETYTLVDKKNFSKKFPLEVSFHTIKENILINLSLTLVQEQDIAISYRKNYK